MNNRFNKTSFRDGHAGLKNEKNPNWKGDGVGYGALHDWVKLRLGKPLYCEDCRTTAAKRFEWANISGIYKRDLSDWKRLCKACHRKFDGIDRGEKSPRAKLTKIQVEEIRRMKGTVSQKALGIQYGVKQSTIWSILNYKTWIN